MPPGHDDDAGSVWRTLSTRRRTSSMPSWSTTHFMRARSLLSRLPVWSNTRSDGLDGGQQVFAGGEVLQRHGRVRRGPEAAGDVDPEARLRPSRPRCVRVVAMTPTSLNMAWPQSVEQPEKLILNLRGRRWPSGLRTKWRKAASAHGVTSRNSWGQAPARWQAITLRTVSPQASREVRPTLARSRMTSGTLVSST